MPTEVTFSLDLEDHRPEGASFPARHADISHDLLGRLSDAGVGGSVYVVGDVAESEPGLVVAAAEMGFEIGLHAWRHDPLTTRSPDQFAAETSKGRDLLEDLIGAAVLGFRAPVFSIVPETNWVPDILAELGFVYSSSVLPAWSPLFGWPGLPHQPFRWPSGLIELPCPITRVGPLWVPFLGGIYLRTLPTPVVERARRRLGPDDVAFTYCHPFDFDPEEPFWIDEFSNEVTARMAWRNRDLMEQRVRRVVGAGGRSLIDRAEALGDLVTVNRRGRADALDPAVPRSPRRPGVPGRLRRSP